MSFCFGDQLGICAKSAPRSFKPKNGLKLQSEEKACLVTSDMYLPIHLLNTSTMAKIVRKRIV